MIWRVPSRVALHSKPDCQPKASSIQISYTPCKGQVFSTTSGSVVHLLCFRYECLKINTLAFSWSTWVFDECSEISSWLSGGWIWNFDFFMALICCVEKEIWTEELVLLSKEIGCKLYSWHSKHFVLRICGRVGVKIKLWNIFFQIFSKWTFQHLFGMFHGYLSINTIKYPGDNELVNRLWQDGAVVICVKNLGLPQKCNNFVSSITHYNF